MSRSVRVAYDRHRDVLFGSARTEHRVQATPVAVDLFLLLESDSGREVGIECIDFSRHIEDAQWLSEVATINIFLDKRTLQPEPLSTTLAHLWRDAQSAPDRRTRWDLQIPAKKRGMTDDVWKRVLEVSRYISRTKSSVADTARVFGVSKSTVYTDVTVRLPHLNKDLARRVRQVLDINKADAHLRGGEAQRRRHLKGVPDWGQTDSRA